MKKILKFIIDINKSNNSLEDLVDLEYYLKDHNWDFESEVENEVLFVLGENSINGVQINEKIFNEELFEYRIVDREDFIEELIGWIGEAKSSDKNLMKSDLEMLINKEDDYMFSSISTNEYVFPGDSTFNELCVELLELNNKA